MLLISTYYDIWYGTYDLKFTATHHMHQLHSKKNRDTVVHNICIRYI